MRRMSQPAAGADQDPPSGRMDDREVGDSLIESVLQLSSLHSLAVEYAEAGIDSLVDNPVVQRVPVVGTIRAVFQGATALRDAFLTKKLLTMLKAIGDVSYDDVRRWRDRIDSDKGRRDTGERVLAIMDRIITADKAWYIGKLFREYLDGRCDCESFLRTTEMIDNALTEDVHYLAHRWSEPTSDDLNVDEAVCARLIAIGLMTDRVTRIAAMSSRPPAPSTEGALIRSALKM